MYCVNVYLNTQETTEREREREKSEKGKEGEIYEKNISMKNYE